MEGQAKTTKGWNRERFYKHPFCIIFLILFVLSAIGCANEDEHSLEDSSAGNHPVNDTANESTSIEEETPKPEPAESKISYIPCDVSKLMDDLDSNALKAAQTYKGQHVELTGFLDGIDSSGEYITIAPTDNDFSLTGIQCFIQNDSQVSKISDMRAGDPIVVQGKITDVGEILGYLLDMDDIYAYGDSGRKHIDDINLGNNANDMDNTGYDNNEDYMDDTDFDGDSYILPNSSNEILTAADLEGLSNDDLRLARNEIYARHGRLFNDAALQEYFNAQSWYIGNIPAEDFSEKEELSAIERKNIAFIAKYE